MARKRRKETGAGELPLEPVRVKLSDEEREAKEHSRHVKLLGLRAVKREARMKARGYSLEIKRLEDEIDEITDSLESDAELRNQRDLFVSPDAAKKGLAGVAAAAGTRHAFVEPAADKVAEGEAPRCAFPGCGRHVDEVVHVVAPVIPTLQHEYAGENDGPCACGEPKDSPCHQVAAATEETPAEAPADAPPAEPVDPVAPAEDPVDDGGVFRKDPEPEPHAFHAGPLRRESDKVYLCTDCEKPEADPVHVVEAEASIEEPAADEARA